MTAAGSCVLLWHRGQRYLVTAAHVANDWEGRSLFVGTQSAWREHASGFVAFNEKLIGQRNADTFDFAFVAVSDAFAASLDGCHFLHASEVVTNILLYFKPPNRSQFFALGWPLNKFNLNVGAKTTEPEFVIYSGNVVPPETYALVKDVDLRPGHHIAIEYDANEAVGPGGLQIPPKVIGMSGGGMFDFPAMERLNDLRPPRLAGITFRRDPIAGVMVSVRIDHVLAAIDDAKRHGVAGAAAPATG